MTEYTVNYNKLAQIEVFQSPGELTNAFLHRLSLDIMRSAGNGDDFYLSLSGGSTPMEIFTRTPDEWGSPFLLRRLKLFWGDERCVPPGSEESNYGNTLRTWFGKISIPENNINRIRGENDPDEEVRRYEATLKKIPQKNGLPCFDLIVLGIGEDGHTASIFPGHLDLMKAEEWVAVARHPETGQTRITLTGRVINNARHVLFLATGSRKIPVLKELFSDSKIAASYPAYHVHPKGKLTWFLDPESGSWNKI